MLLITFNAYFDLCACYQNFLCEITSLRSLLPGRVFSTSGLIGRLEDFYDEGQHATPHVFSPFSGKLLALLKIKTINSNIPSFLIISRSIAATIRPQPINSPPGTT